MKFGLYSSIANPPRGEQLDRCIDEVIAEAQLAEASGFDSCFFDGNSGVGKPGTDGQKVDVIDIEARKIIGTIDFGHLLLHGARPRIITSWENSPAGPWRSWRATGADIAFRPQS